MKTLREQMDDAMIWRGFAWRTRESYLAAVSALAKWPSQKILKESVCLSITVFHDILSWLLQEVFPRPNRMIRRGVYRNQLEVPAKYTDTIIKATTTPNMNVILIPKFLSVSESFVSSNELISLLLLYYV